MSESKIQVGDVRKTYSGRVYVVTAHYLEEMTFGGGVDMYNCIYHDGTMVDVFFVNGESGEELLAHYNNWKDAINSKEFNECGEN